MIKSHIEGILRYHLDPDEEALKVVVEKIIYHTHLEIEVGIKKVLDACFSEIPQ